MVIYADVLVCINLFVNFFLLRVTGLCLRMQVQYKRLLVGALIGGLYALVLLVPSLSLWIQLPMHIGCLCIIVAVSFSLHSVRGFLKICFTFFGVNFAFGGAMLAIWLLFQPKGMLYQNGTVYFDISISVLIITTLACYIFFSVLFWITKRRVPDQHIYTAALTYQDKTVYVRALLDTGNSLSDGFSNAPVCIGDAAVLRKLAPEPILAFLEQKDLNLSPKQGIRVIPYRSVDGSGVLRGFVLDSIYLPSEHLLVRKPVLVQSRTPFDRDDYTVILSQQFFERGEKHYVTEAEAPVDENQTPVVPRKSVLHKRGAYLTGAAVKGSRNTSAAKTFGRRRGSS